MYREKLQQGPFRSMPVTDAIVITSCGKRKSVAPHSLLRASSLERAELPDLAAEWLRRVDAATPRLKASELYQGRAFREAEAAAISAGAPLYVLSAGLGLISADSLIPSYSITMAEGAADSIVPQVSDPGHGTPRAWWQEIQERGPGTSFVDLLQHWRGLVLVAC